MKRRCFLTLTTVLATSGLALPVMAADLSTKAPIMPAVSPTYNWTGAYLGLNGGGAWGSQDPLNIITDRFDPFSVNMSGGMFGGTVGAQVQVARIVLGVEADLDWASVTGSGIVAPSTLGTSLGSLISMSTKIDAVSTARFRAGFAANNWLFYATGGAAVEEAKTSLVTLRGLSCGTGGEPFCSGSDRKIGATAGAGVEWGITPNLSAKLEYLYIAAASVEVSHLNAIRVGLNYRFGGF